MVAELEAADPLRVGRYRITGRLGAGGMGRVYLGGSPGGRLVAVKVVRPELADDPGFRARFAREVAAARKVTGLFTAALVDADPDAPTPWLATAYVPGAALDEAVAATAPGRRTRCACWAPASPRRWRRSTPPGWCTGTSSRPTCCSPRTARASSTSGSPSPWRRPRSPAPERSSAPPASWPPNSSPAGPSPRPPTSSRWARS